MSDKKTRELPRICIVAAYFGPLPPWFSLWLASCEANRKIDFLLVTDQDVFDAPGNMRVISEGLEDVREHLRKACGAEVCLERPYKLCDYKPLFGSAYAEELVGYDYWGFCDVDLVFGDLARYLQELKVWRYDKFLPLGHLFLVRNEPSATEAWRLPLRGEQVWRTVVATEENHAFDEVSFNGICLEHAIPTCWEHPFADVTPRQHRFTLGARTEVRDGRFGYALGRYKNYRRQVFWWRGGRTGRTALSAGHAVEDEFMYVHFQKRHFTSEQVRVAPGDDFYFGSEGFFPMSNFNNLWCAVAVANPYGGLTDSIGGGSSMLGALLQGSNACYAEATSDLRRRHGHVLVDVCPAVGDAA
ncbi:DUF6625 family protein [Paratractidigestivibacter sp.]|uniref:DUF6625 family protein n=1 Tax=Paratractidigestivibacter sp. TaxID=2847316 RepID=UPI002AC89549|nr:DUF6625 family protein [Paratractidigestivibacter sp.]